MRPCAGSRCAAPSTTPSSPAASSSGGGRNESGYDRDWFVAFRKALRARYPDVQLIGADAIEPVLWDFALAMVDDRERCLTAGATAYLTKPVQLSELSRLLRRR